MDSREAAINKKRSSSGGDQKKAKTSPSPPAYHDHQDGGDVLPLPPPVTALHLCSLPDIAQDAIASYLTMVDTHCMMESNPWMLEAYGGKVKEVNLSYAMGKDRVHPSRILLPALGRRPNVMLVTVSGNMMGAVVKAMRKGYLNKLQMMQVVTPFRGIVKRNIAALLKALAGGRCPKINELVLPGLKGLESSLGAALRSRMEEGKGCCGLKSLDIRGSASSLSPLLSSGACEALEDLQIVRMSSRTEEGLSEWLVRTNASHLRTLSLPNITVNRAITALCSPGVAPMLHVLHLYVDDASLVSLLSQAIGEGAWPHLREFGVKFGHGEEIVPSLMEAIDVGATELVSLRLTIGAVRPEAAKALARMLRDGGCPRLERLDLSKASISEGGLMELWKALEGGAPCNSSLRRLDLSSCGITSMEMRGLMESMGRGALPHLECLDISYSRPMDDGGVLALAEAMAGGVLGSLQELNLCCVWMDRMGASALFQALRDHNPCPHLNKLFVGWSDIGDGGVMELAKAIEAGALQHLQELELSDMSMGDEGFKSLVKAIVARHPHPGCPRLEMLDVGFNKQIGNDGIMYLSQAMKMKGSMEHLREIRLNKLDLGSEALRALFKALGHRGVCPNLTKLCLGVNDVEMQALIDELKKVLEVKRTRYRHCSKVVVE